MKHHDRQDEGRPTIRVALDSSSSLGLVQAAVRLAAEMGAELEAILIEDINLIRLADLPFARQISHHSSGEERIGGARIERELRIQARKIERLLVETAAHARVSCTFRIVRGAVDDEIRAVAAEADLLALWGAQRAITRHTSGIDQADLLSPRGSDAPATGAILILSCQSPHLRESLVLELIRQPGQRLLRVLKR
jgi:hypothetical protein